MGNNENLNTNGSGGPWWKPAMQIFSEISTWIAVPIILAVIVGKMLDTRYDTKPTLLLLCAGLAFLISAYGIVKSVRAYGKKYQKQIEEEKNK